jgi:hypothetical protein
MNNATGTVSQTPLKNISHELGSFEKVIAANEAIGNLITEGGDDFYNYVNRIGLAKDPGLIVLSSQHNYFYDNEEMSKAKTVIDLTELNHIKEIKILLQSYLHFMPQRSNFVGCFVNNKKFGSYGIRNNSSFSRNIKTSEAVELGIVSRNPFINMLYSMMDLKTNTYLSERRVTIMLGVYGFKVLEFQELNGLTFFHSQKIKSTFN